MHWLFLESENQFAKIFILFVQIIRQPPYADGGRADCFDAKTRSNPLTYYRTYSKSACLSECCTSYVIKECGCRDFHQPGKNVSMETLVEQINLSVKSKQTLICLVYFTCRSACLGPLLLHLLSSLTNSYQCFFSLIHIICLVILKLYKAIFTLLLSLQNKQLTQTFVFLPGGLQLIYLCLSRIILSCFKQT